MKPSHLLSDSSQYQLKEREREGERERGRERGREREGGREGGRERGGHTIPLLQA